MADVRRGPGWTPTTIAWRELEWAMAEEARAAGRARRLSHRILGFRVVLFPHHGAGARRKPAPGTGGGPGKLTLLRHAREIRRRARAAAKERLLREAAAIRAANRPGPVGGWPRAEELVREDRERR